MGRSIVKGIPWKREEETPEYKTEEYTIILEQGIDSLRDFVCQWFDRYLNNYEFAKSDEEREEIEEQMLLAAYYALDVEYKLFDHPLFNWITFDVLKQWLKVDNIKKYLEVFAEKFDFELDREWALKERRGHSIAFDAMRTMEKDCTDCEEDDEGDSSVV